MPDALLVENNHYSGLNRLGPCNRSYCDRNLMQLHNENIVLHTKMTLCQSKDRCFCWTFLLNWIWLSCQKQEVLFSLQPWISTGINKNTGYYYGTCSKRNTKTEINSRSIMLKDLVLGIANVCAKNDIGLILEGMSYNTGQGQGNNPPLPPRLK